DAALDQDGEFSVIASPLAASFIGGRVMRQGIYLLILAAIVVAGCSGKEETENSGNVSPVEDKEKDLPLEKPDFSLTAQQFRADTKELKTVDAIRKKYESKTIEV